MIKCFGGQRTGGRRVIEYLFFHSRNDDEIRYITLQQWSKVKQAKRA